MWFDDLKNNFIASKWSELQGECRRISNPSLNIFQKLAAINVSVAELIADHKECTAKVILVDTLICLMDYAENNGWNLYEEVVKEIATRGKRNAN